jgi:mannose-6-phosphate isomerase-like protein (cupin superfamily)
VNYTVLNRDELPCEGNTDAFEGVQHDVTDVSFIWVDMPPGGYVRLHRHPYKEVFIIQEGVSTFTIGSTTLAAQPGQVIILSANVPHKFRNSGEGRLRQMDIHLSKQFITEWLED